MRKFNEVLKEELSNPKFASAYINEHLSYKGSNASEHLLEAISKVLETRNLTELAKKTGVSRRMLYYVAQRKTSASLDVVARILSELGLTLKVEPVVKVSKRKVA